MKQVSLVSVIIPTINRENEVVYAVNAVLEQDYPNFEVIVVDNGSTDNTVEVLRELDDTRLKVILEKKTGVNRARNAGIAIAKGEYIAFLDDDAKPQKDWLRNLILCLEETGAAAVGGRTIPIWIIEPSPWILRSGHVILGIYDRGESRVKVRSFVIATNMIIRREVVDKIGRLNEGISRERVSYFRWFKLIKSYDEVEYCYRIRQIDTIYYEPKAVVNHIIYPYVCSLWFQIRLNFGNSYCKSKVGHRPAISSCLSPKSMKSFGYDQLLAMASAIGYLWGIICK